MKRIFRPFLLFICFESTLYSTTLAGNYSLISQGKPTSLYLNRSENTVVQTATNLFISDMTEVSGNKPTEISTLDNASIIVATVGKSKEIDQWLRMNNVSAKRDCESMGGV
jgi:hypothetical protein